MSLWPGSNQVLLELANPEMNADLFVDTLEVWLSQSVCLYKSYVGKDGSGCVRVSRDAPSLAVRLFLPDRADFPAKMSGVAQCVRARISTNQDVVKMANISLSSEGGLLLVEGANVAILVTEGPHELATWTGVVENGSIGGIPTLPRGCVVSILLPVSVPPAKLEHLVDIKIDYVSEIDIKRSLRHSQPIDFAPPVSVTCDVVELDMVAIVRVKVSRVDRGERIAVRDVVMEADDRRVVVDQPIREEVIMVRRKE